MALNQQETSTEQINAINASWTEVQETYVEIRNAFGFQPTVISTMPEQSLPGTWAELKNFFFNPHTALEPKFKDLIAYSVSSQIPCDLMNYMNRGLCIANQASPQEQSEAIAMGAITRHWSTVLNGLQLDHDQFHNEVDHIMNYITNGIRAANGRLPPPQMFLVNFPTVDETYQDIVQTLGVLPQFFQMFPEEGLPGAWSEFKAVQLNPHTSLSGKHKELIGLAVASQIPCDYCVYFHQQAARFNGASDREIKEAIGVAAMTRHWSALFHGAHQGVDDLHSEMDRIIKSSSSFSQTQLHS
jgi:AhpD family alkylhydroperoxidase